MIVGEYCTNTDDFNIFDTLMDSNDMHLTIFDIYIIYCTCLVAEVFLPISTSFQKSDQQGACCCLDNRDPFRWPFCNEVVGRTLQACHEFQVATKKKVTCAGSAFPNRK